MSEHIRENMRRHRYICDRPISVDSTGKYISWILVKTASELTAIATCDILYWYEMVLVSSEQ